MKQRLWKETTTTTDKTPFSSLKRSVLRKGLLAAISLTLAVVMLFAMTTAWYKNVVQTSGLLFQVDQWGLDGSVNIQDELIGAIPGDSGSLNMSVENTSDGIISVDLGVSKGDFYNAIADMRKRVYFYIDDMAYRGGEHTPRVYLNSMETYTYTVLPAQNLVLGQNGNAAPLMWEWVFDVLGYYFYGTVTTDNKAQISEYLRPVEYALDEATFRDGVLQTVDGSTTPAAFIKELSEDDGFEGTVTTTVTASDGRVYYPVSVDDTGKGVWIYLCNLGEIEYETMVDTELGSAKTETERQFETYLHVTAQQKELTVIEVVTEDQLIAALSDRVNDMVRLTGNVSLTKMIQVKSIGEKILDLNGHTLSSNQSYAILAYQDVSLTIMNGTVKGGSATNYGVSSIGGDVALSNVTVTDCKYGVSTIDSSASRTDSRLTMKGCTIRASGGCVYALGNGTATSADTCVVIEDCVLESTGNYALLGNGSNQAVGTDIRIFNSTLWAVACSIYHPQHSSTLYIQGSVLEAATPLVVKSGTVEVVDSTITALTGAGYDELITEPALVNSGFSCNGAGVSVETNYTHPCSVTIGGITTVTATHRDAVLKYESTNPLFTITITGGTYSSDVSAYVAEGYRCVKEGSRWVVQAE